MRQSSRARSRSSSSNGKATRNAVAGAVTARGCISIASGEAVMRQLKTSESVARDIVHDVVEQGLATGDSLPSEAVMLEQYGVSRESLREALRLLEVQGLISIRRGPGGGPIVGTVDPANIGRVTTLYFYMAGATYAELLDAWVIGESVLSEMAARNPSADARRTAMAPYLDGPTHDAEDVQEFMAQHSEFHTVLGSLANNTVLQLTMQAYGKIVSHHVAVASDPRRLRNMLGEDHRAIAQAVSSGHHNRARELMVDHIRAVVAFTRDGLGAKVNDYIEWL